MISIGKAFRMVSLSLLLTFGCAPTITKEGIRINPKHMADLSSASEPFLNKLILEAKKQFGCIGVGVEKVPFPAMIAHARNMATLKAKADYIKQCLGEKSGELGVAVGRPIGTNFTRLPNGSYVCIAYGIE